MGNREVAPAVIPPLAAAITRQQETTRPFDVLVAVALKQRIHIAHIAAQHGRVATTAGTRNDAPAFRLSSRTLSPQQLAMK